jgi:hypothetical protein
MHQNELLSLGLIFTLAAAAPQAWSQDAPTGGVYQIISGRHTSCCGIGGPLTHSLPDGSSSYIELTVDTPNKSAAMRILGDDLSTVLQIPADASREEFNYSVANGVVLPDRIQFGDPLLPPIPGQPSYSFVLSNSADGLVLNGTVYDPCLGCADIPETFQHTNVVAALMPVAGIRVSEVEICWNAASNLTYQVQYRTALDPGTWIALGSTITGNGAVQCVADKVPADRTQRFYRVLIVP